MAHVGAAASDHIMTTCLTCGASVDAAEIVWRNPAAALAIDAGVLVFARGEGTDLADPDCSSYCGGCAARLFRLEDDE
jgi:hypothetical protein